MKRPHKLTLSDRQGEVVGGSLSLPLLFLNLETRLGTAPHVYGPLVLGLLTSCCAIGAGAPVATPPRSSARLLEPLGVLNTLLQHEGQISCIMVILQNLKAGQKVECSFNSEY